VIRRIALLSVIAAPTISAQVGHDPARSPYRYILPSTTVELLGSRIGGSGGPIPVGPRDATLGGFRVLLRANSTVSLGFGVWAGSGERNLLDPLKTPPARDQGPVDVRLMGAEAAIQMNLTGGKHWHGLAPFAGVGLGLASSREDADDPSGYQFGNKFYFAPMAGTRVMLGSRAYLRVEGRGFIWNLKYPTAFSMEPTDIPNPSDTSRALNPTGRSGQYVVAPALQVGIGWSF
jgi:hypothetical protein